MDTQLLDESIKRKRMGDMAYNYEKFVNYIKINKIFIIALILFLVVCYFLIVDRIKTGFEQATNVACSGDLSAALDKDYEPIEMNNVLL